MSEEADTREEEVEADSQGPRCGELLAEARREQQISVSEIAKELHLDELKVRALERNEFEVLGAPVFAKGHLRKYSQLVGVDEDDVFTDYYTMTRTEGMPPIVSRRRKVRREITPGPWVAVGVLLIIAAAAYWWFVIRIESAVVVPAPAAQSEPEETQPSLPEPDESSSDPELIDEADLPDQATVEPEPQPEVEPAARIVDPEPPPADQIQLTLRFSGDCWTEINDADGQQLYFRMGRAGETLELSGRAPLSALFGDADNVDVLVNNQLYELPAPNSANRTVRVAILNQ
jgi:cytoskeleton protein RodZ